MEKPIRIQPPLTDEIVEKLEIGDEVLVSGIIYTGRDAAHKRLVEFVNRGQPLPFDIKGQIIYYVGPTATQARESHWFRRPYEQLQDGFLCASPNGQGLERNGR